MPRHIFYKGATAVLIMALSACESVSTSDTTAESVFFEIKNTQAEVIGRATLTDLGKKGVQLDVKAFKISEGAHGIHFHVKADCQAPDFKSAGGHINPKGHKHGLKNPHGPDNADMENLVADKNQVTRYTFVNDRVTLRKRDDRPALLDADGSALVIHASPDDQITQPIGGAGPRIACAELKH